LIVARIQRADPAARRKAVIILAVAAVLGLSAIAVLESHMGDIESWLEQNIEFLLQHTHVVFIATLVMVLPVLGAGVYLLVLGNRIVRSQRFPPPGLAVIRDTVALEGARAVRRARIIQALAVLLLCAASAIPVFVWSLFESLAKEIR
jgi:hypothetical protein